MGSKARIVVGRDGRIALVNRQAERLLGHRALDLLGARTEEIVPEQQRARHVEERDRYLAEPWPEASALGFHLVVIDKSGGRRRVFCVPEPIASEDGLWVSITLFEPTDRGDEKTYPPLRASSRTPATA